MSKIYNIYYNAGGFGKKLTHASLATLQIKLPTGFLLDATFLCEDTK